MCSVGRVLLSCTLFSSYYVTTRVHVWSMMMMAPARPPALCFYPSHARITCREAESCIPALCIPSLQLCTTTGSFL